MTRESGKVVFGSLFGSRWTPLEPIPAQVSAEGTLAFAVAESTLPRARRPEAAEHPESKPNAKNAKMLRMLKMLRFCSKLFQDVLRH